jgi:hypothetical protein
VVAGYAAATSGSGADHVPGLTVAASAGAAGICLAGYYLGKRADRRVTTIRLSLTINRKETSMWKRQVSAMWMTAILLVQIVQAQNFSFRLAAEAPIGTPFAGPLSVAVGDFNGDGVPDLAAGDYEGASFAVILRAPDGQSLQFHRVPLDGRVRQIAVADLDGDGILDAVAVCASPNMVAVLKGRGDGTFEPPSRINLPSTSNAILAADLNGDGIADLAIGQEGGVLVAFGAGDATFGPPKLISLEVAPVAVRRQDLNGDGIPDLAIAGVGSPDSPFTSELARIYILLGSADGSFRTLSPIPMGIGRPFDLAIGDFNDDSKPDLAVSDRYNNQYWITLGNGDGTFGALRGFPMAEGPLSIAAGDLNGDGMSDLVIGNYYGGKIAILLSRGDGTFDRAPDIQAKGDTFSVALADLDGDGIADVIAGNHSSRSLLVAMGRGGGLFQPAINFGSLPFTLAVGAFGPQGTPAAAVTNYTADSVVVLRGGLDTADNYPVGISPSRVASGDFNGDGILDLATLNESDDLSILIGDAGGHFLPARNIPVGKNPSTLVAADFNNDGLADLLVTLAGNEVLLLLNQGNGEFGATRVPGIACGCPFAVADFNDDGVLDLVTGGEVNVFLGKSGGSFQLAATYHLADFPGEVLTTDVNGDGKPDIISSAGTGLAVLLGKGDGSFEPAKPVPGPPPGEGAYYNFAAADFDGDGKVDLAVLSGRGIAILPGNGDGTFRTAVTVGGDARTSFIAPIDWNQDGKVDIVTTNRQMGTVSVWLNQR